jgi:hypothetical protein
MKSNWTKYSKIMSGLFLLALCWTACQKDTTVFTPESVTQAQLLEFLTAAPNPNTKSIFALDGLSKDTMLMTANGTRVFLTDTDVLFGASANGTAVPCSSCAKLRLEVTEVFERGDMIARNLPTIDASGFWLETAGAVHVAIYCNDQALQLLEGRNVKVQIPSSSPTTDDFFVYGAAMDNTGKLLAWKDAGQPVFQAEWQNDLGPVQKGYELLVNTLGWTSAQKMFNDTTNKFCLDLPPYYNADNTIVFLLAKGRKALVVLIPEVIDGKTLFCADHVPAGIDVQVVTLTKIGDEFRLGYKETEAGNNSTFELVPNNSTEISILDFLGNL